MKQELATKNASLATGMGNVDLIQLEEQRKQAEQEKSAALNELEVRSREFM